MSARAQPKDRSLDEVLADAKLLTQLRQTLVKREAELTKQKKANAVLTKQLAALKLGVAVSSADADSTLAKEVSRLREDLEFERTRSYAFLRALEEAEKASAGSDVYRAAFLAEHAEDARAIYANEMKRREAARKRPDVDVGTATVEPAQWEAG